MKQSFGQDLALVMHAYAKAGTLRFNERIHQRDFRANDTWGAGEKAEHTNQRRDS